MYDKQIDRRWIGSVKAWMAEVDGTTVRDSILKD